MIQGISSPSSELVNNNQSLQIFYYLDLFEYEKLTWLEADCHQWNNIPHYRMLQSFYHDLNYTNDSAKRKKNKDFLQQFLESRFDETVFQAQLLKISVIRQLQPISLNQFKTEMNFLDD